MMDANGLLVCGHRFRQETKETAHEAVFLFPGGSEQGACAPCV